MSTLYVRNYEQKVLLEQEIFGQISDGQWENATPHNHWEAWCDAEVEVRPSKVGRNFLVRKDSYNLLNKELLSIIGKRMMAYVRMAKTFPSVSCDLMEHLVDIDGEWGGMPTYGGDYYSRIRKTISETLTEADVEQLKQAVANEALYTEKDLKNDLRDLKVIFKQYIREEAAA